MISIRFETSDFHCHTEGCGNCHADDALGEALGHYRCQCCGTVDPLLFMIRNDLWMKATGNRPDLLLCWQCTEKSLGHPIRSSDLIDCPLNRQFYPGMMRQADHGFRAMAHALLGPWQAPAAVSMPA